MKQAKKLTSILLVMMMFFTIITPAFAAEGDTPTPTVKGSITIDNPQKVTNEENAEVDATYKAYKIFDVVYSGDAYAYTISNDSDFYQAVSSYANGENSGLTLTEASGKPGTYVVTTTTDFSAPQFAVAMKDAIKTEMQGVNLEKANNGSVTASDLPLGYYIVTTNSGALCNLTTTNPDVIIHDKNSIPFEKTDNKSYVEVGETVNYTINAKVPDTTGFTEYEYSIYDKMSAGLTFNKDVKVTIGNDVVYGGENNVTNDNVEVTYENVKLDDAEKDFKVNIKVLNYAVGTEIKIEYTAKVNEAAVTVISQNEATLVYSNDPTNKESKDKITDKEKVYSAKIVIDKYAAKEDTNDKSTKLAGAEFVLKNSDGKYYKYTPANATENVEAKVEWVDDQDTATVVTTNTDGVAEFPGLKNGTYSLVEIKAPDGYNLLQNPVSVTIEDKSTDLEASAELSNDTITGWLTSKVDVPNSTGTILPDTGGMGTTIFYVLGAVMVVGAGILLVTRRRMTVEK